MQQAALRALSDPQSVATPAAAFRSVVAEGIGTAFLVAAVVGSGIMGEQLAGGNVAIALLANTLATGAALVALILALGPVSGAHFNPVVTLTSALAWRDAAGYIGAQIAGGIVGAILANAMFAQPLVSFSTHARGGAPLLLSEFVATFGLVTVIAACSHGSRSAVAYAVAAYIVAAYWFTASTSFANPAVTIARALSDTFAGIRPADVPGFVCSQLLGAIAAARLTRWMVPR
jgi:glycerol uptake facilitator-like aquaporin